MTFDLGDLLRLLTAGPGDELERAGVPMRCPRCSRPRRGEGLHYHSQSVWCVGCGWSRRLMRSP